MKLWTSDEEPEYVELINSPEQKEIETTKFQLVNNIANEKDEFKSKCNYVIPLFISGHRVDFLLPNDEDCIDFDYLNDYLKDFIAFSKNDKVYTQIYYLTYANGYGDQDHILWREKSYYTRTVSKSSSSLKAFDAIQRHFLGHIDITHGECFIKGPNIVRDYSDLIDNIFLTCVAPKLIEVNSLALHAATVVYKDEAYVFYGPSGVGKSTIAEFCHNEYGFKVMSGDQIYLRLDQETNELWACPCVNTIHNFTRDHASWESKPKRVKLLAALTRGEQNFTFKHENYPDLLGPFLREIVYLPEYKEEKKLLDTAISFLENNSKINGIMSYSKGYKFWHELIEHIKGMTNERS